MKISRLLCISRMLVVSLFCCGTSVYAMKVQPLIIEMDSVGRASTSTLNVVNDGANKLPIEIAIERVTIDNDSQISYQPADDDWLVFPPQTVIPPGGQQNFRLQWLGEPDLESSQSFHVIVKQVPVEFTEEESGIQLVYNFRALVSVAPPNTSSILNVNDVSLARDKSGLLKVSILLENPSRRHAMLNHYDIALDLINGEGQQFWSQNFTSDAITQTIGAGLVQPGNHRRFQLPIILPDEAKEPGVKAMISLKEAGF